MNVSLDIMSFVEQQILPRYNAFGRSHGITHAQRVIKNSLELANMLGADVDMAYVIAAYHDLGMEASARHTSHHGRQDPRRRRAPSQVVHARANKDNEGGRGGPSRVVVACASLHIWEDSG